MITHPTIIGLAWCPECRAERMLAELVSIVDEGEQDWPPDWYAALPEWRMLTTYELAHLAGWRWAPGRPGVRPGEHRWTPAGEHVATMLTRTGLHVEVVAR